jgi:hypothetical protein
MEAGIFSLLSQLRFPEVGAIGLDISARHAVHLIDPRKALPPGPKLGGTDVGSVRVPRRGAMGPERRGASGAPPVLPGPVSLSCRTLSLNNSAPSRS